MYSVSPEILVGRDVNTRHSRRDLKWPKQEQRGERVPAGLVASRICWG